MLLPLTNAQRIARFGSFRFVHSPKPGNYERVVVMEGWTERNVTSVHCPQLPHLGAINIHELAAKSFLALWADWYANGCEELIHTWNGSLSSRYKRGKAPKFNPNTYQVQRANGLLSNHCWGTAFDINAEEYELGEDIDKDDPYQLLVPIAERHGWFCGGNFRGRKDWMHWEFTGLAEAQTKLEAAQQLLNPPIVMFKHERQARQKLIGATPDGNVGPNTLGLCRQIIREAA